MILSKNETRKRRKVRIRKKISGTADRPRLVVYRSNLHIYAQIVDDAAGVTLAAASSMISSFLQSTPVVSVSSTTMRSKLVNRESSIFITSCGYFTGSAPKKQPHKIARQFSADAQLMRGAGRGHSPRT